MTAQTYYFKDKDHTGKRVYTLVLNGTYVKRVATRKEAETWHQAQQQKAQEESQV